MIRTIIAVAGVVAGDAVVAEVDCQASIRTERIVGDSASGRIVEADTSPTVIGDEVSGNKTAEDTSS